ncbi:MAG TPA: stage III sporulation protein AE [Clostridiales bacterium]|nr:stage III sporulation protein AE [Clostridiales bacterium]
MKKVIFALILIFMLWPVEAFAAPQDSGNWYKEMENLLKDQLNELNTSDWEPFLKYIHEENTDILGNKPAEQIIGDLLTGRFTFGWQDFLNLISRTFFKEFSLNLSLMAKIIVIALLCAIFRNMNDSFNNPSVGEIGYFVCYSVVIILVIQSLISIVTVGRTGIERMSGFMQVIFPVLLGLLMAVGNFTTTSLMQPAIGVLIGTVGSLLTNIVFPLITLSAVITLVNHISERVQIQKLGKLLNNLCIWTLTLIFTIFIGVLTIQGAMTATFDGISIRTAKFALDTFVPIVGKMFSQSLDTIIGCSLLLKNAVGVSGLIIILLLCLTPVIKIFTLMLLYKLSGALLEPITDKRIAECLNGIGGVLNVLLITVMGIALMFFFTVTLIIGTGNATMMLR